MSLLCVQLVRRKGTPAYAPRFRRCRRLAFRHVRITHRGGGRATIDMCRRHRLAFKAAHT